MKTRILTLIAIASFTTTLTVFGIGTGFAFDFSAYAQTDNDSGQILERNYLYSGFFTDENTRISQHVHEVGQKVKYQQRFDNNSTNSDQKGTLKLIFYHSITHDDFEHLKTFDFNIKLQTYEIFEIDYTFTKTGSFVIETVPTIAEPYYLGGNSYLFSVVDKYSKAYEKDSGCNENFRSVTKPDYSTVVCVSENTYRELLQRGWNL